MSDPERSAKIILRPISMYFSEQGLDSTDVKCVASWDFIVQINLVFKLREWEDALDYTEETIGALPRLRYEFSRPNFVLTLRDHREVDVGYSESDLDFILSALPCAYTKDDIIRIIEHAAGGIYEECMDGDCCAFAPIYIHPTWPYDDPK